MQAQETQKHFFCLCLCLVLALCSSSLPRACAKTCALDAPAYAYAYVVVKTGFNVHCFVRSLDFSSWSKKTRGKVDYKDMSRTKNNL